MKVELDTSKITQALKTWGLRESVALELTQVIVDQAQPDPEVWEPCGDRTVALMFVAQAKMWNGEIRRVMWPNEPLYVTCSHSDHRVQVGVNFGRPEGKVQVQQNG